MKIAILAFSDRGEELAKKIGKELLQDSDPSRQALTAEEGYRIQIDRSGRPLGARDWTEKFFHMADALIFVGATGIAVRAIAPHVRSKAEDPAVIVVDERGIHAISLLSGHLGGANELTETIADLIGAEPVITTATDVGGIFAVDDWARKMNCRIVEKGRIVKVSSALLAGDEVPFVSRWNIEGEAPEGINFFMTGEAGGPDDPSKDSEEGNGAGIVMDILRDESRSLHLVPRICALGIGCRRGTTKETIQEVLEEILTRTGLRKEAIKKVASIDLKKDEEGLIDFCEDGGWEFVTYSVEELMAVPGSFSSSDFVRQTTGADNICERSAVRATGGRLILKKYSKNGVTIAIAKEDFRPSW